MISMSTGTLPRTRTITKGVIENVESIAVFIAKGGTGKTTTAVNLSAALALQGKRVMLIDGDPQGTIATYFNLQPVGGGLAELLMGEEVALQRLRDNLVLISSGGYDLWEISSLIDQRVDRYHVLGRILSRLSRLDYIIFDCPPALNVLTYNILYAADHVLLPFSTDYLTAITAVKTINALRELPPEHAPHILGVAPNFYNRFDKAHRAILRLARGHFGELLTETIIRYSRKISEAPNHAQTVFEYSPASRGSSDFASLADEVVQRCVNFRKGRKKPV
jgi:chromosome partitioning protein